jgi:ATP-dependent DNA helicase RecQ
MEKFMQGKPLNEQESGKLLLAETSIYAESSVCRRKTLLHYFGETYPICNCGNCDNCLNPKTQVEAKEELSAIIEVITTLKDKFKADQITDILLGRKTANVKAYNHEELEQFGCLENSDARTLNTVIRQAVISGYISKDIENFGVLKATNEGLEFLKKPKSFKIVKDNEFIDEEPDESTLKSSGTAAVDPELFSIIKDLRKKIAKQH